MITYRTGTPTENGVYAIRTPIQECPSLLEDEFVIWADGKFWYRWSDVQFRREIKCWIGPLSRKVPDVEEW